MTYTGPPPTDLGGWLEGAPTNLDGTPMFVEPVPLGQIQYPPARDPAPDGIPESDWRAFHWFPIPGAPIQYKHHQTYSTWDDVWNWVRGKTPNDDVDKYNQTVTPLIKVEMYAAQLVANAIAALGGEMNKVTQYATNIGNIVDEDNQWRDTFTNNHFAWTDRQVGDVARYAYGGINAVAQQGTVRLQQLQAATQRNIQRAVQPIVPWTIQEIYWPLQTQINHVNAKVNALPKPAPPVTDTHIRAIAQQTVAPALAGIAALQLQLKPIKAEVDNCLVPMCQDMGPGTPFNNLQKLIDWNRLIGLLIELSLLDLDRAKAVATGAVTAFETPARDFVTDWFDI